MTDRPMTEGLESDSAEIVKAAAALVEQRRDDFGDTLPYDLLDTMEQEYWLVQARLVAAIVCPAAVRGMREALEFYADDKRYWGPNQNNPGNDPHTPEDAPYLTDVTRDRGARALAVLSGIETEQAQARATRSAPISTDTKGTTK